MVIDLSSPIKVNNSCRKVLVEDLFLFLYPNKWRIDIKNTKLHYSAKMVLAVTVICFEKCTLLTIFFPG